MLFEVHRFSDQMLYNFYLVDFTTIFNPKLIFLIQICMHLVSRPKHATF